MNLAEEMRPRTFDDIIGVCEVVAFLRSQVELRTAYSVVLSGPAGCGKTTLAEIYAGALVCQMDDAPCGSCADCFDFENRGHPNLHWLVGGAESDLNTIRREAEEVQVESMSGGRVIMIVDRADQLSPSAWGVLRDIFERTLTTTFILCVSDIEALPAKNRFFVELNLAPPSFSHRLAWLERACHLKNWRHDIVLLEQIAEYAGNDFRALARDLSATVVNDVVSSEAVELRYNISKHRLDDYLSAVIGALPLDTQLDLLFQTNEELSGVTTAIEAALGSLFQENLFQRKADKSQPVEIAESLRFRFLTTVAERADVLGLRPRDIWLEILDIWRVPAKATRTTLLTQAYEFDRLLHAENAELPARRAAQIASLKARFVDELNTRRSDEGTVAARRSSQSGDMREFLTVNQTRDIWDAASFMVEKYGVTFNAKFDLYYQKLGLFKEQDAKRFLSKLTHELGLAVKRLTGSDGAFWAYVNEFDQASGLMTRLVLHLPDEPKLEIWMKQFLSRTLGAHSKNLIVVWPHGSRHRWNDHLVLLKSLTRGLDPKQTARVKPSSVEIAMLDLLEVPKADRCSIGALPKGIQRKQVAHTIAPKRRKLEAEGGLEFLSAWEAGAWHALIGNRGLLEFEARKNEEQKLLRLSLDYPVPRNKTEDARYHAAKKKLQESWRRDAEARLWQWA